MWLKLPTFRAISFFFARRGLMTSRESKKISMSGGGGFFLELNQQSARLQAVLVGDKHSMDKPFYVDFSNLKGRGSGGKKENLIRAFGKTPLSIWDMTAGIGRDSFILASRGHEVMMFEENLHLHSLVTDGLGRLKKDADLLEVCSRLTLYPTIEDSTISAPLLLSKLQQKPDAIYLDPMYPQGIVGRKSAVKKDTQWLHRLASHSSINKDQSLFDTAMNLAGRRVVVKRPVSAEPLNGIKPTSQIGLSGSQRFDIYVVS
jgi:16S rRNA (guanine1516-N2)-methyltransferase